MADGHTAAFWAGGAALIARGSIFMAVTGFEPTKNPSTVWANSWFDLGFAFVILGLVITAAGVVMHFRREAQPADASPAVNAAGGAPSAIPPDVSLDAFKPYHQESGEFPDGKALTFGFDHVNDHPGAYIALNPRRCTVVTPSGLTVSTTRTNRYFQYPTEFENAPSVRLGLYRFRLEGQLANGGWVDITSGEHEVKPPPKTGLEVVIDGQEPTPFVGIGQILEIKFHVTNHDTMEHRLSQGLRDANPYYYASQGAKGDPEHAQFRHEFGRILERRGMNRRPETVGPGETVHGIHVSEFGWDPRHRLPLYTLVISDGRREFTARPTYADDGAADA